MDVDMEIIAAHNDDDDDDDDVAVPSGNTSTTTTTGGINTGREPLSKFDWSWSLIRWDICLLFVSLQFLTVVTTISMLSNTSHVPSMLDMGWAGLFSTLAR